MADGGQSSTGRPEAGSVPLGRAAAGGWSQLARLVLGGANLAGGVAWVLLNPERVTDVAMGAVMAASGLVLLMTRRFRLPARPLWAVVGGTVVLGALAGLAVHSTVVGGMYGYAERRGFPFAWLSRGGEADELDAARRAAESAAWQVGVLPLLGDVVVCASAGLLVLVLARSLRRPESRDLNSRRPQSRRGMHE